MLRAVPVVMVMVALGLVVPPARERRTRADRGGRYRGARSRKQAAAIELMHEYSSRRELPHAWWHVSTQA